MPITQRKYLLSYSVRVLDFSTRRALFLRGTSKAVWERRGKEEIICVTFLMLGSAARVFLVC